MKHFTERKHLVNWIMENCTRKTVVRAMDEGGVENLGAFIKLGPFGKPGWAIKVTSEIGKVWIVCVVLRPASERRHGYSIYITPNSELPLPHVPWEHWDGIEDPTDEIASDTLIGLHDGDNPTEYARLRDERRAEIARERGRATSESNKALRARLAKEGYEQL